MVLGTGVYHIVPVLMSPDDWTPFDQTTNGKEKGCVRGCYDMFNEDESIPVDVLNDECLNVSGNYQHKLDESSVSRMINQGPHPEKKVPPLWISMNKPCVDN